MNRREVVANGSIEELVQTMWLGGTVSLLGVQQEHCRSMSANERRWYWRCRRRLLLQTRTLAAISLAAGDFVDEIVEEPIKLAQSTGGAVTLNAAVGTGCDMTRAVPLNGAVRSVKVRASVGSLSGAARSADNITGAVALNDAIGSVTNKAVVVHECSDGAESPYGTGGSAAEKKVVTYESPNGAVFLNSSCFTTPPTAVHSETSAGMSNRTGYGRGNVKGDVPAKRRRVRRRILATPSVAISSVMRRKRFCPQFKLDGTIVIGIHGE